MTSTSQMESPVAFSAAQAEERNGMVLKTLAAAAFLVFFNAYMVAPLIPALSREFGATARSMGWVVPAYVLPYGLSTLFYGPLSDRAGRRKVLLILLPLSALTTLLVSLAWSIQSLIVLRILSGLTAGGIVTISLALIGDLYPYQRLGRALGWMFGAIAGGMAFGATLGAWLNPYLGWRNEFIILAGANGALAIVLYKLRGLFNGRAPNPAAFKEVWHGYAALLKNPRGAKTFSFILLNGLFHGGVFSWLGFLLSQRYHLNDEGIGKALLGYGIPGLFMGPVLGRLADRFGRRRIIPAGFLLASACALSLVPASPLWTVTVIVTALSFCLDMTHPLMAGIVADLDPKRRGQAMGLNAFSIFAGFGTGAILFQLLLDRGFPVALTVFGGVQFVLGVLAFRIFR
ncbi:MAG TPA: MFS transporter, partial [Verrucomicrobiales bacterium]|nr:MFS transporter [Verrucomicrobiales bacterium]